MIDPLPVVTQHWAAILARIPIWGVALKVELTNLRLVLHDTFRWRLIPFLRGAASRMGIRPPYYTCLLLSCIGMRLELDTLLQSASLVSILRVCSMCFLTDDTKTL